MDVCWTQFEHPVLESPTVFPHFTKCDIFGKVCPYEMVAEIRNNVNQYGTGNECEWGLRFQDIVHVSLCT